MMDRNVSIIPGNLIIPKTIRENFCVRETKSPPNYTGNWSEEFYAG